MRKSRITEPQIFALLKEADAGMKIGERCRKHGIVDSMYYKWKSKHADMVAPNSRRVIELVAENAKLMRMHAELALENTAMNDLVTYKL